MDKIIYSFLKELESNDDRLVNGEKIIIPTEKNYNISKEAYGKIIKKLEDEKLIICSYAKAKGLPSIVITANITLKGKGYLKENLALGEV